MKYKNFGEYKIENKLEIEEKYQEGYVLTRKKDVMSKVRSLRVDLKEWEPSSENRRILKKYEDQITLCPIIEDNYDWHISKLIKDFYNTKFGEGTFSTNKASVLLKGGSDFNSFLKFSLSGKALFDSTDGYSIVYSTSKLLHYAYPFYKLELINSSFGIYMMTKTIEYFKEKGLNYIYLGSVHEEKALYKLQFKGAEWFDEKANMWSNDINLLKERVRENG